MTPEGRVKAAVKRALDHYKSDMDVYWPVPAGYGPSHLDCIICFRGRFIAIETKAPGKKPTPRQKHRIDSVRRSGGLVFVIDGTPATDTIDDLIAALENIKHDTSSRFDTTQGRRCSATG